MRRVVVRYRVRPDRVEENERLVRAVYEELAAVQPEGLRYATVKLDDGVTFVHVAVHETENPLPGLAPHASKSPASRRSVRHLSTRSPPCRRRTQQEPGSLLRPSIPVGTVSRSTSALDIQTRTRNWRVATRLGSSRD